MPSTIGPWAGLDPDFLANPDLQTPTWLARPLSPGRVLEVDVALEVAEKALAICVVTSWFLYVRRVVRAETRRSHEK
jgi:hypothetical protein